MVTQECVTSFAMQDPEAMFKARTTDPKSELMKQARYLWEFARQIQSGNLNYIE
jgi:hypothetical protein